MGFLQPATTRRTPVPPARIIVPVALLVGTALTVALGRYPPGWGGTSSSLVIEGGWVFHGTGGGFEPNPGIVIRDSIIAAVDGTEAADEAGRRIRLSDDDYILPGLVDVSAHLDWELPTRGAGPESGLLSALLLANGVTSTAPAEANRGSKGPGTGRVGPRVWGPVVLLADSSATRESMEARVEELVGTGAQAFLARNLPHRELIWLVEAAHHRHRPITAEFTGSNDLERIEAAVRLGVDRIRHEGWAHRGRPPPTDGELRRLAALFVEHGTFYEVARASHGYGAGVDPDVFARFRNERAYLTPRARSRLLRRTPPAASEAEADAYRAKGRFVRTLHEVGASHLVTVGTEHRVRADFLPGFSVHREMHALHTAGMPVAEVLEAATLNGARALGIDDRVGTLEPGKLADLMILAGDPSEDIRNTRHVRLVVLGGTAFDATELLRSVRGRVGLPVQEERPVMSGRPEAPPS